MIKYNFLSLQMSQNISKTRTQNYRFTDCFLVTANGIPILTRERGTTIIEMRQKMHAFHEHDIRQRFIVPSAEVEAPTTPMLHLFFGGVLKYKPLAWYKSTILYCDKNLQQPLLTSFHEVELSKSVFIIWHVEKKKVGFFLFPVPFYQFSVPVWQISSKYISLVSGGVICLFIITI